jgi:hypothetical protein
MPPWIRTLIMRFVASADDARLERRLGSRPAQRILFAAMAAAFNPRAADGFCGNLCYELVRPATGAPPALWTIQIAGRRAHARRGWTEDRALTMRLTLADFIRIGAGTIDPATPVLQGRASFQGDFALAVRLPEMFGVSPPRPGRG